MRGPRRSPCGRCGFQSPARCRLPDAIRAITPTWAVTLRSGGPALVPAAARARDELHAVTNRIARILTAPGSTLSPVHVERPTALTQYASIDLIIELLRQEADRLASITASLDEEWGWVGSVGSQQVTVRQLADVPLHSAHRQSVAPGREVSVVLGRAHLGQAPAARR